MQCPSECKLLQIENDWSAGQEGNAYCEFLKTVHVLYQDIIMDDDDAVKLCLLHI